MTAQKAPTGLSVKMQLLILGGGAQGSSKHEGSLCQRDHAHLQCGWGTFGQTLKTILRNCPLHLCICARIAGTQDLNSSTGRENTPVLCALTICRALWQHAMIFAYVLSLLDQLVYSFPPLPLNHVNQFSLPHPWMIPWEDSSTFSLTDGLILYVLKSTLQLVSHPSQSFSCPVWGWSSNSAKPHGGRTDVGVRLGQKGCSQWSGLCILSALCPACKEEARDQTGRGGSSLTVTWSSVLLRHLRLLDQLGFSQTVSCRMYHEQRLLGSKCFGKHSYTGFH